MSNREVSEGKYAKQPRQLQLKTPCGCKLGCNCFHLSQKLLPLHIKKETLLHINQKKRGTFHTVTHFFFPLPKCLTRFLWKKVNLSLLFFLPWWCCKNIIAHRQSQKAREGFWISTRGNNRSFAAANFGNSRQLNFTSSCCRRKLLLALLYRRVFPFRLAPDAVFVRTTGGAGQTAPGGR